MRAAVVAGARNCSRSEEEEAEGGYESLLITLI